MKTATRQYAKRQVKWIKSKLLPAVHSLQDVEDVTVVLLDASGEPSLFSLRIHGADLSLDRSLAMAEERQRAGSRISQQFGYFSPLFSYICAHNRSTLDFLDRRPLPNPLALSSTAALHLAPPQAEEWACLTLCLLDRS